MNRREWLKGAAASAVMLAAAPPLFAAPVRDYAAQLAELERVHGGRLGVAILDTGNGRYIAHRADERFLMCSTFKLLLAAAVLARVDHGVEELDRRVMFDKATLLDWSPVTQLYAGPPGMTVAALCQAAITMSDNTAANLLLASSGGPAAVTRYARSLGDTLTRLDRSEPTLNHADGEKDTTTPRAMLGDIHKLLLGDALAASSRGQLVDWLQHCQTGAASLRAGLPADWRTGDKTGSGVAATNDVAILWPPARKPLLVTAYYDNGQLPASERRAVLAEVGRIAAAG